MDKFGSYLCLGYGSVRLSVYLAGHVLEVFEERGRVLYVPLGDLRVAIVVRLRHPAHGHDEREPDKVSPHLRPRVLKPGRQRTVLLFVGELVRVLLVGFLSRRSELERLLGVLRFVELLNKPVVRYAGLCGDHVVVVVRDVRLGVGDQEAVYEAVIASVRYLL